MEKVIKTLVRVCHTLMALFLTLLVFSTFWQVLARFVLRIPNSWTEEVARICSIWIVFLGSAIAIRDNSHLVMDIFLSKLKGKARMNGELFILAVMLITSILIFIGGINYFIKSIGKTAVTLPIPANFTYSAVPISAGLFVIFIIERAANTIKARRKEGLS